jgi:hypothetical protein
VTNADQTSNQISLARAKDIVAIGIQGHRLPVIEFMEAQQAQIERLDTLHHETALSLDTMTAERDRLRAALGRIADGPCSNLHPAEDCPACVARDALSAETNPDV